MDINKVIILGHKAKQPLITLSSELVDGFEPHGHIVPAAVVPVVYQHRCRGAGVYPGWCGWVGPREGAYRVPSQRSFEAYLMNYIRYSVQTAVSTEYL